MNYRFEISKPNSNDFRCEIAVNGNQTFQEFHDKIVETLKFDRSLMASFFTLDKTGKRRKEIALLEMPADTDAPLVMNATAIRDVVNANCIDLEYVYDFFANQYLKIEYAGAYTKKPDDIFPLCISCEGNLPHQTEYDPGEKWTLEKEEDEEYDDSFMEEFGEYRPRKGRNEDFRYDDEEDEFDENADNEDGFDDRYESLDDYIDKL